MLGRVSDHPVNLGLKLRRGLAAHREKAGLAGVSEIVPDAHFRLDPVEHGDVAEAPCLDHFEPFIDIGVGNPKIKVGVLIREIGNRHGLDPVYGHEVVMADGTAITVAGRLILAPRRIGNDGTEKRQLRNVFRYALGFSAQFFQSYV